MTRQVGGQTVYIMRSALTRPNLPTWHHPGRTTEDAWQTRCGQTIAVWPAVGLPRWKAVGIRRLYAGTFAAPCATCVRSLEAHQRKGKVA